MPFQGSVIARVYTSDALLPIFNAPVSFTQVEQDGTRTLLAIRQTNTSGLTSPVYVPTPEPSSSQFPGSLQTPYATVDIQTSVPGYNRISVSGVQIFPDIETIQDFQLRPVPISQRDESLLHPQRTQAL